MATRGVYQLCRLNLYYCEYGGSSRAVREFIASTSPSGGRRKGAASSSLLAEWAASNPHVEVRVVPRNGRHPHVRAEYKTNPPRGTVHQVCLKGCTSDSDYNDYYDTSSSPSSSSSSGPRAVRRVLDALRNRSGRKLTKLTRPVNTQTPSVQGVWTPFLDLSSSSSSTPSDDDEEEEEAGNFSVRIVQG